MTDLRTAASALLDYYDADSDEDPSRADIDVALHALRTALDAPVPPPTERLNALRDACRAAGMPDGLVVACDEDTALPMLAGMVQELRAAPATLCEAAIHEAAGACKAALGAPDDPRPFLEMLAEYVAAHPHPRWGRPRSDLGPIGGCAVNNRDRDRALVRETTAAGMPAGYWTDEDRRNREDAIIATVERSHPRPPVEVSADVREWIAQGVHDMTLIDRDAVVAKLRTVADCFRDRDGIGDSWCANALDTQADLIEREPAAPQLDVRAICLRVAEAVRAETLRVGPNPSSQMLVASVAAVLREGRAESRGER